MFKKGLVTFATSLYLCIKISGNFKPLSSSSLATSDEQPLKQTSIRKHSTLSWKKFCGSYVGHADVAAFTFCFSNCPACCKIEKALLGKERLEGLFLFSSQILISRSLFLLIWSRLYRLCAIC